MRPPAPATAKRRRNVGLELTALLPNIIYEASLNLTTKVLDFVRRGGPCGDRTHDTRIKSPVLCLAELTAQGNSPERAASHFSTGPGRNGRSLGAR